MSSNFRAAGRQRSKPPKLHLFAASLSVAVTASCGGGGGGRVDLATATPAVFDRAGGFKATHLEQTDVSSFDGEFGHRYYETVCESQEVDKCYSVSTNGTKVLEGSASLSYENIFDSDDRLKDRFLPWTARNGIGIFISRFTAGEHRLWGGWSVRHIAAKGQYSAFFSQSNCRTSSCENLGGIYSAAFGEWHSRPPSVSAIWRGAMAGTESPSGVALVGEAAIIYTLSDNDVDVRLSNIAQRDDGNEDLDANFVRYTGPNRLTWTALPVSATGGFATIQNNSVNTFHDHTTLGYIEGDFFGPNAEETAGVFERWVSDDDIISGAWLAKR